MGSYYMISALLPILLCFGFTNSYDFNSKLFEDTLELARAIGGDVFLNENGKETFESIWDPKGQHHLGAFYRMEKGCIKGRYEPPLDGNGLPEQIILVTSALNVSINLKQADIYQRLKTLNKIFCQTLWDDTGVEGNSESEGSFEADWTNSQSSEEDNAENNEVNDSNDDSQEANSNSILDSKSSEQSIENSTGGPTQGLEEGHHSAVAINPQEESDLNTDIDAVDNIPLIPSLIDTTPTESDITVASTYEGESNSEDIISDQEQNILNPVTEETTSFNNHNDAQTINTDDEISSNTTSSKSEFNGDSTLTDAIQDVQPIYDTVIDLSQKTPLTIQVKSLSTSAPDESIDVPSKSPTTATPFRSTYASTARPTIAPTARPTIAPTARPTIAPTARPTFAPTVRPTIAPTSKPAGPGSAGKTRIITVHYLLKRQYYGVTGAVKWGFYKVVQKPRLHKMTAMKLIYPSQSSYTIRDLAGHIQDLVDEIREPKPKYSAVGLPSEYKYIRNIYIEGTRKPITQYSTQWYWEVKDFTNSFHTNVYIYDQKDVKLDAIESEKQIYYIFPTLKSNGVTVTATALDFDQYSSNHVSRLVKDILAVRSRNDGWSGYTPNRDVRIVYYQNGGVFYNYWDREITLKQQVYKGAFWNQDPLLLFNYDPNAVLPWDR